MSIDIKDIITLSDEKNYVVVSKIDYDEDIYYYLTDVDDNVNTKFLVQNKERSESLLEVKDAELLQKLFPMFLKKTKESINLEDL